MVAVQVPVVPVMVIVEAGEHHRSTGTATGSSSKGVTEKGAVGGKAVNIRSYRSHVAITPQCGAKVIGNDDNDVFFYGQQAQVRQEGKRQPKSFPKMYQKMVLPCVF